MCGIAGLIIKDALILNLHESIKDMTKMMRHRGPDGEGFYFHKNVAFGHRRLAIIDRSAAGYQPMNYAGGQYVITYNGEIYNYIEVREELKKLGYKFVSDTDTEVILAAYAEWGEQCVHHFNGMWAFAILDKKENTIFCSRDRFGVKPFYYIDTPELFVFASEIKPLLPFLKQKTINKNLLSEFLLMGIADDTAHTFFNDIFKLVAGDNLTYCLRSNNKSISSYYRVTLNPQYINVRPEEAVDIYMHLLQDAIELRLRSDVPVGTCLSGGLDSSTITSIAASKYQSLVDNPFTAITAISEQESNNEAQYAEKIVNSSKIRWLKVQPSYDQFLSCLPKVVLAQEEPFSSTSMIMQYCVMQAAREHGIPVLLDGQAADETLLGYERYYINQLMLSFRQYGIKSFFDDIRMTRRNNTKMTFFNMMLLTLTSFNFMRFQRYRYQHRYLLSRPAYPQTLTQYSLNLLDMFNLQKFEIERMPLLSLLRYEDKNSMAHSIETRLPFLDYRLVEAALSFPMNCKINSGWTKWLLRKGIESQMPSSIAWRKNKIGFEGPDSIWLKKHAEIMYSTVVGSDMLNSLAKPGALKKNYLILKKSVQWRLYSLALWEKVFDVILNT